MWFPIALHKIWNWEKAQTGMGYKPEVHVSRWEYGNTIFGGASSFVHYLCVLCTVSVIHKTISSNAVLTYLLSYRIVLNKCSFPGGRHPDGWAQQVHSWAQHIHISWAQKNNTDGLQPFLSISSNFHLFVGSIRSKLGYGLLERAGGYLYWSRSVYSALFIICIFFLSLQMPILFFAFFCTFPCNLNK